MFLKVSQIKRSLRLGGMLYWSIGGLYVVMVRVVLFPHFIPVIIGFFRISMAFFKWVFDSLEVLNGFFRQVVVSRKNDGIRKWTR